MARIGESGDLLKCSFCGKSQKQVKKLIAGPAVYICDECIDLCNEIIEEEFTFVVGVASTGLIHFRKRSISIIKLLQGLSENVIKRRMAHITNLEGSENINYPRNYKELNYLLMNYKNLN